MFDQLAARLGLRTAEDAHALAGDFLRCGGVAPDKDQIAAGRKPLRDLTSSHRLHLESFRSTVGRPDLETAHDMIRAFAERSDGLREARRPP